jgi:hypothetical protein
MRTAITRVFLVLGLMATSLSVTHSPAVACGLSDWLFGRSTTPEPIVVGYAPATAAANPCNPCDPCNVCPPVTTIQAPRTGCCWPFGRRATAPTPPAAAPTTPLVNPAPQTYYRTSWKRIPVTVYRPSTTTDPATGFPVTVMKPCTTYQWQAQRQPTGWLGRLFNPVAAPPASTNTMAVAPGCGGWPIATTTVPMSSVGSSCCGPAPMTVPSPTTAIPQLSSPPTGAQPGWPSTPTPAPAGTPMPSNAVPSNGATPADTRPSLSPDDIPSASEGEPAGSASYRLDTNSQNSRVGPSLAPAMPSRAASEEPAEQGLPGSGLQPVPDPDAQPAEPNNQAAPKLLDPRDRVAATASSHAWACVPIAWNTTAVKITGRTLQANQPTTNQPTTPAPLNDRGWRTVRP